MTPWHRQNWHKYMRIHCLQQSIPSSCMLNSSAIIRRQQFLIRALGGSCSHQTHHQFRMQSMFSGSGLGADAVQPKKGLDADACGILRLITPPVDPTRYKGQAGNLFPNNFQLLWISSHFLSWISVCIELFVKTLLVNLVNYSERLGI